MRFSGKGRIGKNCGRCWLFCDSIIERLENGEVKAMSETMKNRSSAQVSLPVRGMTCAACVAKVEKTLKSIAGVQEVHVNLLSGKAMVTYASEQVGVPQMVKAIQDIGYEVPEEEVLLTVRGMTCSACVAKVEKSIKGMSGVTSVVVNLPAESAKVKFYPGAMKGYLIIGYIIVNILQ